MKFDDLDSMMRTFETALDYHVLPGIYMVARLDGRSFTRLTKEMHSFDTPFDVRFRDFMAATTEHLMTRAGFRIIYGYFQSDEISLLFHPEENTFSRKMRKFNSVLAGEASAKLTLLLGDLAVFDCRISQLPREDHVVDYFRWRQEDAHRNALNAHCYWTLRGEGQSVQQATDRLSGMSVAEKNELLFQHDINFNAISNWQKRGVGLYWEAYEKEATNPITGEAVVATRRRIKCDPDLPIREEYSVLVRTILRYCNDRQPL